MASEQKKEKISIKLQESISKAAGAFDLSQMLMSSPSQIKEVDITNRGGDASSIEDLNERDEPVSGTFASLANLKNFGLFKP